MHGVLLGAHGVFVVLSLLAFGFRAHAHVSEAPWAGHPRLRILGHGVDGGLLLSALALCGSLGLWPFQAGWLTAKLIALLVYALCGVLAFRVWKDPMAKLGAVALGLLAFAYSAAVAQAQAVLPL
jgi:uncharacterized membrane protein SirB2